MPARPKDKITLRDVRSLQPWQTIWDGSVTGLAARRQASSVVSYYLSYRAADGRKRTFTIGKHGSPWTPDTARQEARRILRDVAKGGDPQADKMAGRQAITVADLCRQYLADVEAGRVLTRRKATKKESTLISDRGRIDRHIIPLLGRRPVASVTRDDVEAFMQMWQPERRSAERRPSYAVCPWCVVVVVSHHELWDFSAAFSPTPSGRAIGSTTRLMGSSASPTADDNDG